MANYILKVNNEKIGKVSHMTDSISRTQDGINYERFLNVYFDSSEDNNALVAKAKELFEGQDKTSEDPYSIEIFDEDTNSCVYLTNAYVYIKESTVNITSDVGMIETVFIFQ